ncbi:bifunctional pyr operon transcriptional regulator/uracil phosphoribosyltransferase PyrR [Salinisphaera sp. W335]|uniref:Bifunctional pyr operon transcriptional regulator/uracil phosphoribosyltransferase PyrR n=1 Tax=Spectribacter hydrogenoxidans TaxID=3075608 RepID=A0ABU3BY54_9GAMM|nr:bifunctional pyr operon transcriptional regulator/uracil phosphoribosyltransferase PyrR [Salinisphaera sp. W335]MDT0634195.1 bifunctional pyr operon transcriptional regulator/uracil phosphoribosyltransferase PyrR [Salinisphaera sp. W335]
MSAADRQVTEGIDRLCQAISGDLSGPPVVVGIHTGGVWLAQALRDRLWPQAPLSRLNISFHRDDFARIGLHPQVGASDMQEDVEGRTLLLVDDVLHTGRTVRAAMNELFDFGRPAAIRLAVLVDRGGRELPIAADYTGLQRDVAPDQQIKLEGPEPLTLVLR